MGVLTLGVVGAVFSSTVNGPASTLAAASLDDYLPTAASASRTAPTTCLVTWTPAASVPVGTTYDVTDGTGTTVATGVSGTSASVTVPAAAVTPTVRTRSGAWVSPGARAAAAPCTGFPDAPAGLTLTPSTGTVDAAWTAPAANGGTLTSYTATISPAPGTDPATCTVPAGTTTCTWDTLTDGVTYTIAVTATSNLGTGPAATATTVPYPSTIMSGAGLGLWLDGADPATLLAASNCSGAAATSTVGCWKDKSPYAANATQATTGDQPALTTSGGRPVPGFDGSSDSLAFPAAHLPTGTADSTQFVVAALTDPAGTVPWAPALSYGDPTVGGMRQILRHSSTRTVRTDTHGSGVNVTSGTWSASAATPTVIASELTGGTTARMWTAGAAAVTATGTYSTTGSTGAVGSKAGGVESWKGPVNEVVVLAGTLTSTQRRSVEEYLARKWGSTVTPQAPTAVSGAATTAASTSANVSWTAPGWNGGSAVTSYTATAVPAAGGPTRTCTATAPATACTLTGLTGGGAQYAVTVTATNAVGTGPASGSATVFSGVPSGASARLWLAADDLDGDGVQAGPAESGLVSGTVATWADKSGGARSVTAPSAGERPPYGTYTLGGYRVPTFTGSTVLKGTGTNPYGITADRSLFVVARERTVDASTTFLVDRTPAQNQIFSLMACSGNWSLQHRNDAGSGLGCVSGGSSPSVNRVDVIGGQRTGTTDSARVSGAPGSTSTLSGPITQNAVAVGRHDNFTGNVDLDVAEVLLYDTYLSGSQRRAVEKYLADKWGGALAPDMPTGLTATATGVSGQATVSWTAPTDIGGSALSLHTARTTTGGFSCTATPPATTCTLGGLTNGTTYTVYVESTNGTGTGDPSTTTTVTPAIAPGAPTGVAATNADTTSSVSWTAPASNGGSAITGYTATAVPSDGTLPTRTCTAASSPCTVTGLTNGIAYTVSVTATNAVGTGPASSTTSAVPYPASVMTTAAMRLWLDGADADTLMASSTCTGALATTTVGCWHDKSVQNNDAVQATAAKRPTLTSTNLPGTAPRFDGTDDDLSLNPSLLPTGTSSSTAFHVAQLTDPSPASSDYRTVLAWGATTAGGKRMFAKLTGSSAMSADVQPPVSTPGAWTTNQTDIGLSEFASASVRTARNGADWVTGTAVAFNTGTTYATVGNSASAIYWQGPIPEIIVFAGTLTNSQRREVDEYLARKWSVVLAPRAPTAVSATTGQNAQSAVSWTAPTWNGGAAVTSYTVTASPGGQTCSTAGTSCTVTGLTNGTSYTFTVTATNSVGAGAASAASSAITPAGVPGAPTGVAVTADDTTSSVSWTAPAANGSPITGYTATAVPGTGGLPTRTCSAASSPCTVTGLTNGVQYSVTVTATNAIGTGPASSAATVTPYPASVMTSGATRLWLDGADTSTLFSATSCTGGSPSTGQTIGCWKDKSTQANDAVQSTSTLRPVVGSLNGRTVPAFDGTNDYYPLTVTKLPTGTTPSAIYTVAVQEDTVSSDFRHVIGWGANNTNLGRVVEKGSFTTVAYVESHGTWGSTGATRSWPTGSAALVDGVITSTSISSNVDGHADYSVATSNNTGTSAGATLGAAPWNTGPGVWKGRIAEVVVVATNPTAAENRSVQEYLARKWGVSITPAAPQSLAATPGTGTASLSWSAPAWNGGQAVTGYTASVSGGGSCTVSGGGTGTTAICTGVPAGSRTFTVQATNSVGTGAAATVTATVS